MPEQPKPDLASPAHPVARDVFYWPVRLAFPLFLISLVLPGFWWNPIGFEGSWFYGWQVLGYTVIGLVDSRAAGAPVMVWVLSMSFSAALAAYVASFACFLLGRYRAAFWLAVPSAVFYLIVTVLMVFTALSEMGQPMGPAPFVDSKSLLPGPGLILWAACPALTAWATWRIRRRHR